MANGSPRERGKVKAQAEAEYLDREPALEAERVMARSRVGPSGPSKGGTAGLKACPLELREELQRTGFLLAEDDFGSFEKTREAG